MAYDRTALPELVLPTIGELFPDVDTEDVTFEQEQRYNDWCTARILQELTTLRGEEKEAVLITRYPHDTVGKDYDSRDVVGLDEEGMVVVLETEGL